MSNNKMDTLLSKAIAESVEKMQHEFYTTVGLSGEARESFEDGLTSTTLEDIKNEFKTLCTSWAEVSSVHHPQTDAFAASVRREMLKSKTRFFFHGYTLFECPSLVKGVPGKRERSWRERLLSLPWRPWSRNECITITSPLPSLVVLEDMKAMAGHPATLRDMAQKGLISMEPQGREGIASFGWTAP